MNRVNAMIDLLKDHPWAIASIWELAVQCGDVGPSNSDLLRRWMSRAVTSFTPTPWTDNFLRRGGWSNKLTYTVGNQAWEITCEQTNFVVYDNPGRNMIEAEVLGMKVLCSYQDNDSPPYLGIANVKACYPNARILGVIIRETQSGFHVAERHFFAPMPSDQQSRY